MGSSENGMDFFVWVGVGLNAWYLMLIGWLFLDKWLYFFMF
ncbi:hypothetical protein NEISICOT_02685 [Neisseria sicca ATCC 29256]|uniref:Uncharacterized protein n=1 Tax=Neisseria sicca ATCC 29256 TaxID=547045 RepID=C6M820_NEISI|nr:hypothetical protein NEISICOT_02685 [Neisseria sicca ATCC 29256]